MKITLDFDNKQIEILENTNLLDVFTKCKDLKLDLKDWSIVPSYMNNAWIQPYTYEPNIYTAPTGIPGHVKMYTT